MIINQASTDSLFAEVSTKVRSSVRQSPEAVVQLSHRRLSGNPLDRDALHVLAAFSLRNQNPSKSLSILHRDPTVLHENPLGHRIAGYAHLAQDQTDDARRHFDQAVRLDPCQSDCWTMLGHIHEDIGQNDWAITYYQRAIMFDDSRHDSALALSRLHARNKNLKEAIHTLRVSILRDRRSAKLNLALAKLLKRRAAVFARRRNRRAQRRFLSEACRCYKTANSSAPSAATFIAQGKLEKTLERFTDARDSFERAVKLDPSCPAAITHLANANVDVGQIEVALLQFQTAIALDPKRAATHFRFSRAKKFKKGSNTEAYIGQLSELVSEVSRPAGELAHLHFALAKVLDDVGRYDQAWKHYDRANRLKPGHSDSEMNTRPRRPVDRPRTPPLQQVADNAERFFTREFLAANRHVGNPSSMPVFIVGMPRSGTTLTEQILSSHPSIAGAGELKLIEQIRQELARGDGKPRRQPSNYPDSLMSVDRVRLRQLADEYLSHMDTCRTSESRVTDKMPTNFMHLGLIALLFPGARVIHCRRNPMDVLVSCYSQNLNAPFCDLGQLVHYHRQYRRIMAHWNQVLPLSIHTLDYESLVSDPEDNARRLIAHCGLEWDPRCLDFHQNDRAVHTPSKWQVRQPMYSSSVEKWRRFESHLKDIAEEVAKD